MKTLRPIAVYIMAVLAITSFLVGINAFGELDQASIEVPDDVQGYAERIMEILDNGELTEAGIAQIQEILGIASRHEVPPWEWQSPPTTVIEQGSGVEAASYIIFKDSDNNVYAKSGDNGEIVFSGSDAATVIQAAIDALPTKGKKIFIKNGTYLVDNISLKSNTILDGESMFGTVLQMKEGVRANVIDGENIENVIISNLTVDGLFPTNPQQGEIASADERLQNGISLRNVKYALVEKVRAINNPWNGIQAYDSDWVSFRDSYASNNGWHGIQQWKCRFASVIGSYAENSEVSPIVVEIEADGLIMGNTVKYSGASNQPGIEATGENGKIAVIGNRIKTTSGRGILLRKFDGVVVGNTIDAQNEGIYYFNGSKGLVIMANSIRVTDGHGIDGYGAADNVIKNMIISGNIIVNESENTDKLIAGIMLAGSGATNVENAMISGNTIVDFRCGVGIRTGSKNVYIRNNNFVGTIYGVCDEGGSGVEIKSNIGYTTESSGTATLENGSTFVTVSHGLAAAPTLVSVTPITNDNNRSWWVPSDNYGSSNFVIYIDSANFEDIKFNWYGEA